MKVILHGCNGKMGRVLAKLLKEDPEIEIVAGIDHNPDKYVNTFPVYGQASACKEKGDVIVDFSHHSALPALIDYCVSSKTPLVTATTGLSGDDFSKLVDSAKVVPIFHSANMSVGINLVTDLVARAGKTLGTSFDIEVIEKHHNKKVDSPSGTAFMLVNAINDAFENNKEFIYGRHGKTDVRKDTHIGIHAVRGGTIVGEHTVIFAGPDEIIEITHTALSKDIFALGAIRAAKFITQQKPGFYNMNSIIQEQPI
ncbi:MAG: 4-hydroxy-tetrahydrodipicolinate reductase [Anaerosolibacter sp.]|nr:4-hydroxy-tetrahydrodipicolinate reductase [Anaerosolibacter sp.]